MKKGKNLIILVLTTVLCVLITCILFYLEYVNYAILTTILSIISLTTLLLFMQSTKTNNTFYESTLNKKIKSYSSIMIESKELPFIEDKNIIFVSTFSGLTDAQNTIKKPIYYKKETETCVFILIDNKEAIVYVHRQNDNSVSPYEVRLKKLISKTKKDIDHSILEDLEKTTIIKFDNQKKYKVSPIRNTNPVKTKNKKEKKK